MLSAEASAEPGRWRTDRAEYQRGIMDAVSDPDVETVVVMKSAQIGWTEILNNVVGYHIHQDPAPLLVVQPTVEMGESWSKDRLAPMLRDSPALRGRVADPRSRDGANTLLHKMFPGGHLTIAGANSPASLASRPIRVVLFDEVDRYPASAGTEGDPITLGRKRTATFWNRKVLMGSTPTIAGVSRIEAAWEQSDRRRYWVPCPHCGERQTLRWAQVQWADGRPETARYHCAHCGAGWSDAERWAAVRRGEWRAEAPFAGTAGFHISELCSPWRRLAETVADFLAAKDRPETFKAWVNTALGETWQERGEAPDWARLLERREAGMERGVVPAGVSVLTAGVDVQGDRIEVAVWGWGPGFESWLVETDVFPGSPASSEPWDALAAMLARDWECAGGETMRIAKVGVDTGGTATSAVYAHLRRSRDPRIMPLKGVEGWARAQPVSGPTHVDVTEGGRKLRRGLRLWTVAVSVYKADLYRRLWLSRGEDGSIPRGWVHLPEWMEPELVRQLVAEQLVTVKDRRGFARQEWRKLRDRNEQLDMAVYARAALALLGADRGGDAFWRRLAEREEAQRPVPPEAVAPATAVSPPPAAAPVDGIVFRPRGGAVAAW
ncbi:phage terminase large subunit family protein [Caldovatus sediminis]|uniref:phage terminase large subunit family protein n=1 Tax=Caldovatus sediminis TaxID=2041189 RepID=UPI001E578B2C|nr:phage terminase large subunit family protein [Caldovatus sediminis]